MQLLDPDHQLLVAATFTAALALNILRSASLFYPRKPRLTQPKLRRRPPHIRSTALLPPGESRETCRSQSIQCLHSDISKQTYCAHHRTLPPCRRCTLQPAAACFLVSRD
jgi:hypothetical protein